MDALDEICLYVIALEPVDKLLYLLMCCFVFQYDYHFLFLLKNQKPQPCVCKAAVSIT